MVSSTLKHIRRALNMPWLATNELKRILSKPYIQAKVDFSGVEYGDGCKFYGAPIVQRHRGSDIELGAGVELRSSAVSNPLSPNHPVVLATRSGDANIAIGDNCGLTGTTIVAEESVDIGDHVAIGANATIVDTDFHPVELEQRRDDFLNPDTAPVKLGDEVFMGMDSIVLKGVTVGQGSVIAAGTVVTNDVPERTLVAGNPASLVREL